MKIEEQVKKLLDSDLSSYQISKETGVAHQIISRLRNEERPISGIRVGTAQKLIDYWDVINHKK